MRTLFTEGRFFLGTFLPKDVFTRDVFSGDVLTEGRFYRIPINHKPYIEPAVIV
jgi:hypothetical protein